MRRALILGGTGLIGRAVAARLLKQGWRIEVTGRDPRHLPTELAAAGARFVQAERSDPRALDAALGDGADLLVDALAYTGEDAKALLPLASRATSTVLLSSRAVYVDDRGRHVNSDEPPRFDGPVREDQPTLPPGTMDHESREGYGPNKVAAERIALDSGLPITVVRPSRVHGIGSHRPHSWVFLRRALAARPYVLLAHRGEGVDQPSAAANIAALIEAVADRPGTRILNAADPDAPNARQIAGIVARHVGHSWREVLLDDQSPDDRCPDDRWPDGLGATPWDRPYPFVLDTSAALELGYRPVGDYATTIAAELDWLVAAARAGDPDGVLPGAGDPGFARFLDDAAEDAFLSRRTPESL